MSPFILETAKFYCAFNSVEAVKKDAKHIINNHRESLRLSPSALSRRIGCTARKGPNERVNKDGGRVREKKMEARVITFSKRFPIAFFRIEHNAGGN